MSHDSIRTRPAPETGGNDERAVLLGWLAFHRATLAMKCEGLTAEQLASRPVPPSNLSLLGLVRHLTEMENVHLRHGLGGGSLAFVYATSDDPEIDFEQVDPTNAEADLARWRAQCAAADEVIASIDDLDAPGHDGRPAAARRQLVKVLQEYARHNGHADLLREAIDGVVGE